MPLTCPSCGAIIQPSNWTAGDQCSRCSLVNRAVTSDTGLPSVPRPRNRPRKQNRIRTACPVCGMLVVKMARHLRKAHHKTAHIPPQKQSAIQKHPKPKDFEAISKKSRDMAAEVTRMGLARAVQGGLPGLGKRN